MPRLQTAPLRIWIGQIPDVDLGDRRQRLSLMPIVRAQLRVAKQTSRTEADQSVASAYQIVEEPSDAELAVMPRMFEPTRRSELEHLLRTADQHGLRTLVAAGGDFEPIMPSSSIILLHPGPTRGAQPHADVLAMPYFFNDRAPARLTRPDGPRPSVAFCGQGATRPGAELAQTTVRAVRRFRNALRPEIVCPPVRGHVHLRAEALRRLREHPGVDDRFVIRDRYRAGASSADDRQRTQQEFDENLLSSTYALCVRGTGNFSARFYEALSFGRVPLYIDSNAVLPLDGHIEWNRFIVPVRSDEISTIAKTLVQAHDEVTCDSARSVASLRAFWERYLSPAGYFGELSFRLRCSL